MADSTAIFEQCDHLLQRLRKPRGTIGRGMSVLPFHEPARGGHQPRQSRSCKRVAVLVLHTGSEVLPWLCLLLTGISFALISNSCTAPENTQGVNWVAEIDEVVCDLAGSSYRSP